MFLVVYGNRGEMFGDRDYYHNNGGQPGPGGVVHKQMNATNVLCDCKASNDAPTRPLSGNEWGDMVSWCQKYRQDHGRLRGGAIKTDKIKIMKPLEETATGRSDCV